MSPSPRKRRVRSPYSPRATTSASRSSAKRTTSPVRIFLPGCTSACHSCAAGVQRPQQQHFHGAAQVLGALRVLLAHGQRMDARAVAEQPRRKHPRIVEHEAIAGREELRQIAECAVFPPPLAPVDHEHARRRAVGERLLRDQVFGEVVVEVGEVHGQGAKGRGPGAGGQVGARGRGPGAGGLSAAAPPVAASRLRNHGQFTQISCAAFVGCEAAKHFPGPWPPAPGPFWPPAPGPRPPPGPWPLEIGIRLQAAPEVPGRHGAVGVPVTRQVRHLARLGQFRQVVGLAYRGADAQVADGQHVRPL